MQAIAIEQVANAHAEREGVPGLRQSLPHPTELVTPPMQRLIGDPKTLHDHRDRRALGLHLLGLPQLRDDLLRRVLLPLAHYVIPSHLDQHSRSNRH